MGFEVVIDGFLDNFESFRSYCDELSYDGETNPVDGVFYPGVNTQIPESIQSEILSKLQIEFSACDVVPKGMFLRLSTQGTQAPHQAHTDLAMSNFSMMLYMNRLEDCLGGTSLLMHKQSGLCENPINKIQENIWREDTNNADAWQPLSMCSMKPNRALLFESNIMHRSEPIGGFGDNSHNGRLVLVFFFDLEK